MFDFVIGLGGLIVAAILYIGDKLVDDIRFHRYHKNKMAKN